MEDNFKKTQFLRTMEPDDEPIALDCASEDECSSFSTLVSRINRREGKKNQKFIHLSIDYYNKQVFFVCVSWEYHLKELKREVPPLGWRELLAKKKAC